ncbi:Panacea domain-containing protein [Aliarcobacter butzleri]|uniref:Panacea domain-containing protein n=1 Tax=Aliarcobacter butzleri TaxID=28197 RepID=UPI003AF5AFAA
MNENLTRVSDKIIHFHRNKYDESISPMKLQKLCYYAQGFFMALENKTLFENDFQAWQHGPVIKDLYMEYKDYGWKQIDKTINLSDYEENKEEDIFLMEIVNSFGSYDGSTLSLMTHNETPWIKARGNLQENEASTEIITKDSIRDYFKSIV